MDFIQINHYYSFIIMVTIIMVKIIIVTIIMVIIINFYINLIIILINLFHPLICYYLYFFN